VNYLITVDILINISILRKLYAKDGFDNIVRVQKWMIVSGNNIGWSMAFRHLLI
jgi:hypothetical protein